jgi:hypothetical protein
MDSDDATWYRAQTKIAADQDRVLIRAADAGDYDAVYKILDSDASPPHEFALCRAAKHGYLEIVRLLIDAGSEVTVHDNYPIRHAAGTDNVDLCLLLIQAGADPSACGHNAFWTACKRGALQVAKLLFETTSLGAGTADPQPLLRGLRAARKANKTEVVAWLRPFLVQQEQNEFVNLCSVGALDFVKSIHSLGVVDSKDTMHRAIQAATLHKQVHVLAWLKTLSN